MTATFEYKHESEKVGERTIKKERTKEKKKEKLDDSRIISD